MPLLSKVLTREASSAAAGAGSFRPMALSAVGAIAHFVVGWHITLSSSAAVWDHPNST